MSETKVIVGLGNPGPQYEYTRHNLGFLAVQRIAEQHQLKFGLSSFANGLTAQGDIEGQQVCLLLPLTYMNNSGVAVRQVLKHTQAELSNLLVVCDDLNLKYEGIRIRPSGSDGGNNGLKSIIARLQTREFSRLRLGIGRPSNSDDTVDYVLSEFSKEEQASLKDFVETAAQCSAVWLKEGIAKAMDQFNKRK